jgi:chromosome partitioning protein
VDFDAQGNASQIFTHNKDIRKSLGGAELLFKNEEIKYSDTQTKGIKLLHGHSRLEVLDHDRVGILEEAKAMRTKVRNLPFDYIIFDTPPSIGPRQVAPMFWSDLVLIPVEPAALSMSGLASVLNSFKGAAKINPGLMFRLVINRFLQTSSGQKKMREQLEGKLGKYIIAEFSQRVHVADALDESKPVWDYTKDKDLKDVWNAFTDRVFKLID